MVLVQLMVLVLPADGSSPADGSASSDGSSPADGGLHSHSSSIKTHNTQVDVYNEVADFIQSALDGDKVCLFSYGQTGSGKTWTMQGNQQHPGIIPRALHDIMSKSKQLQQYGWSYHLSVSYLEIYNNELIDLLITKEENQKINLTIRQHYDTKQVYVENLSQKKVHNEDDINELINYAHHNRSIAATAMNNKSSRSHAIFTLYIKAIHKHDKKEVNGLLNLVDLAGSERLTKSKVQGQRLKETMNINKSLSSLNEVFNALALNNKHIPYRNSKLTFLLSNCLQKNGKTLMFINLSPIQASANESLCSLRFAKIVQNVTFNHKSLELKKQNNLAKSDIASIKDLKDCKNHIIKTKISQR